MNGAVEAPIQRLRRPARSDVAEDAEHERAGIHFGDAPQRQSQIDPVLATPPNHDAVELVAIALVFGGQARTFGCRGSGLVALDRRDERVQRMANLALCQLGALSSAVRRARKSISRNERVTPRRAGVHCVGSVVVLPLSSRSATARPTERLLGRLPCDSWT